MNYNCHQSYKMAFCNCLILDLDFGLGNAGLWTEIPGPKHTIEGFLIIVFASNVQLISVKKINTFTTESCLWACYFRHKCPIGKTFTSNENSSGRNTFYCGDEQKNVLHNKKVTGDWQHGNLFGSKILKSDDQSMSIDRSTSLGTSVILTS